MTQIPGDPSLSREVTLAREVREQSLQDAHKRVQGKIIGVEVTAKPSYLPGNIQFYGSRHGLDASLDPFGPYIERAGLRSGSRFINTRFAHTPATLRALGEVVLADWESRKLIPRNYILAACPPRSSI